jgi:hypothetical protein
MMRTTLALAMLLAAPAFMAGPASAAMKCRDDYQVVQGREISTPYCADNYLARVAREYGVKVSDAAIRNNPNKKSEVCRFIGHDPRVKENCLNETSRGSRGF